MSRFASRKTTARYVLPGPCQCPGQPHDEDYIVMRSALGMADVFALDDMATPVERIAYLATEWNLLLDDGTAAPLTEEYIGLLLQDDYQPFGAWFSANMTVTRLPNGSAVPSQPSSRGNGSHHPKAPTAG